MGVFIENAKIIPIEPKRPHDEDNCKSSNNPITPVPFSPIFVKNSNNINRDPHKV
jgi:hypothetical protein